MDTLLQDLLDNQVRLTPLIIPIVGAIIYGGGQGGALRGLGYGLIRFDPTPY
jgi:hypothetical protein